MLTTIGHIEHLLRNHDCVVIPGFGAFIAHSEIASRKGEETILPPSRTVNFNSAITHNDGLLANSFMMRDSISYDKAVDAIAADVALLKSQLVASGEFSFGKIGTFRLASEGQVIFSPSGSIDAGYAAASFGLRRLSLAKLESAAPAKNAGNKEVVYLPISRNLFKIAAMVGVLIVLAFTLTTPIAVEQVPDYAGFNTAPKERQNIEVMPQSLPIADSVEIQREDGTEREDGGYSVAPLKKFHIIIASFTSRKQAMKFIEQSDEAGLMVLAPNSSSVYRVSLSSNDSWSELEREIDSRNLRDKYPDIWISRK